MTGRTEITFDSGGVTCAAHLYLPDPSSGQAPCVVMGHGFPGTRNLGLTSYAERFAAAGMAVLVCGWLRRSPRLIPVFGGPADTAAFASPHDKAIIDQLAGQAPDWRNAVTARMLFPLMRYQPRIAASRVNAPLLVCIAEEEKAASPALTADLVARAPKAEVRRYPIGHSDAYTRQWVDRIAADQIAFLRSHLGSTPAATPQAPAR